MTRTRLSAMEYTILGIAWKRGPCTTYALMKELASSTSTYYKKRAGTAYPLVERLIGASLLEQAEEAGARGEKLVSVTETGLAALRNWLSAPIEFSEVAHTVDFIRLRVFYLGAAGHDQRRELLDQAIDTVRAHLTACESMLIEYGGIHDTFSELATLGVIYEARARLEWLTEIRSRALQAPIGKPLNLRSNGGNA